MQASQYTGDGNMPSIPSFADLIRYEALITPYTVLLKDGCLMSGIRYYGIDLDTAPEYDRASISMLANNAIKRMGQDYMIHFEVVRVPTMEYPSGRFTETVTKVIDHERQQQFELLGNHFETETYCFLTWQPPLAEKSSVIKRLYNFFISGDTPEKIAQDKQVAAFESVCSEFVNSLSHIFTIEPLREENLLSAISLCVNGQHTSILPDETADLDSLLARDAEVGEPLIYDNKYLSVISIDGFPKESFPCINAALANLPFEYRWSTRYIPLDFREAYERMSKEQKKWAQRKTPMLAQLFDRPSSKVNKDAILQEADVNDALQALNEGSVSFGHYTCAIIIRSENIDELSDMTREAEHMLETVLFKVIIEKRNSMDAFIGSLPGHGYENVRKPLLHSLNLAHMVQLGSMWPGEVECSCPMYPSHSPALIQASSAGGSPFRLHLHFGDVGHTLILGPTGAGKSTLLALIAAQFDRYPNSQIFLFDKGRSMYPLVKAMKRSTFYDLGSEHSPKLCPLSCLETRADLTWAMEYVETLVALNKGEVTPQRRALIESALQTMAKGTASTEERSLGALQVNIQDEHIRNALNIYTLNGSYGQYLDGTTTDITYAHVNAFELEELMNHAPQVVTPTLLYLFHEVEKRLDGRPTLIILDEAWLALSTPLFAAKLKEWLKVLRKANAAVILATQSLVDILNSDISSAVLDSCPTKILLPNPEAKAESMRKLYAEQLRLNDAEINTIAAAIPKQDYFFVNPYGRRLFRLSLGDVSLSFVGAASKDNLKRIDELIAQYGNKWPAEWLRERRLDNWAEYWVKTDMEEVTCGR